MSLNSECRDAAFAAGQTRYNTGQPCKHGHMSDRYTVNGGCIACASRHVMKVTRTRDVMTLQLPVAADMSEADRVRMVNYLGRCIKTFHQSVGLEAPINDSALTVGEATGRRFTECK